MDVPPGRRAAAMLAFAVLFAVLDVVIAVGVHGALGDAGGWVYRTGALVHGLGGVLIGGMLALPFARSPDRPVALASSAAAAGLLLTLHAFAYQIHAMGGHLPTWPGLTIAASAAGGGTLLVRSLALGAFGVVLLYLATPRLARRLEARTATRGGRITDLLTALLLGSMWFTTVLGADGPLYYGATPPVVHLAFGAPQAEVDAPAMTTARHVHRHQHAHGDGDHDGHDHHDHEEHASTLPQDPPPPDGIPRPPPDVRALLQQLLQSDPPRTVPDPSFPFCRGDRLDPAEVTRRSVVLLDLSGVSSRDVDSGDADGALARLADGAPTFRDVHAPTTTALPGLMAALSGVPALVEVAPLVRLSLPSVPRLPAIAGELREAGFRTAAFDATHLAVDDRGAVFRVLGFDHVDGPSLAPDAQTHTTGVRPDAATMDAFFRWARAHRRREPAAPYVALVALRGAPAAPMASAFDAELARMLAWYREEEAERGTILVVFSDHVRAEPGAEAVANTARYDVPLMFYGLEEEELARARTHRRRQGALHDLPQTLLALLGSDYRGCHQGVDLLQPQERWPARRVILSFFGERQESLVAHDGDHVWVMPRGADQANLYNVVEDEARTDDLWSDSDSDWGQMKELRDAYVGLMAYLRGYDRFIPPTEAVRAGSPPASTPSPRRPVRVAALDFGEDVREVEDRVDAAIRAGFERIRIPVAIGADGAPVITAPDTEGRPLAGVLARFGRQIGFELVLGRFDGGGDVERAYGALRAVVAAAKSAPRGASVRISTQSVGVALAIAQSTDLPVGLELGMHRRSPAWLHFAQVLGARFVTVTAGAGRDALVQRAHEHGLEIQIESASGAAEPPSDAAATPDAITASAQPAG